MNELKKRGEEGRGGEEGSPENKMEILRGEHGIHKTMTIVESNSI